MESAVNKQLGFDPSTVKRLTVLEILKRIGPGIILAGVVVGPGAITTAAMLGSSYGYHMLWLFIPIFIMSITFMLTCYRLAMLTGMPLLHGIRHYYGHGAAAFVGICLFFSCLFFTFGNISGSGAGMSLLFGVDWKIGALIMLALLLGLYFSKDTYSKIEKGVMVCILGMILAFYATLYASGGPDPQGFILGLTHWGFPEGSVLGSLAFLSTHASITAGIYGTYLGAEKKWKKQDLFNGTMMSDACAHVLTVILISGAIVTVGAIVLHPTGLTISSPVQMAGMLEPVLGSKARFVMGAALLGSAFSALMGNTQRGGGAAERRPGLGSRAGKQTGPLELCGLPSPGGDCMLCLQRVSHPADFPGQSGHQHRDPHGRALCDPDDLEKRCPGRAETTARPADFHDPVLSVYHRADSV